MSADETAIMGHAALIAPVLERNTGFYTSPQMLAIRLKNVRNLISDDSPFKQRFSEADCDTLVKQLFGDATKIDISSALTRLRKEADTPEIKLLIRTLAIYSFDATSPKQTKRISPKQLYEDLHMLEKELLPQPRMSGTSKFLVYTLAMDDVGLVRFHIFPPATKVPDQLLDDAMMIHQHPMDSSSIILAGEVINRHHTVTTSSTPTENGLALYEISTVRSPTGTIDRTYRRQAFIDKTEVIAQHHYQPGDYYHLPGVAKEDFKQKTGMELSPEMLQTFHTTESRGLAATLFTQRKTPYLLNDQTIQPVSWHGEVNTRSHQATILDPNECYKLLVEADAEIKKALSTVNEVNCTHLARLTEDYLFKDMER